MGSGCSRHYRLLIPREQLDQVGGRAVKGALCAVWEACCACKHNCGKAPCSGSGRPGDCTMAAPAWLNCPCASACGGSNVHQVHTERHSNPALTAQSRPRAFLSSCRFDDGRRGKRNQETSRAYDSANARTTTSVHTPHLSRAAGKASGCTYLCDIAIPTDDAYESARRPQPNTGSSGYLQQQQQQQQRRYIFVGGRRRRNGSQ